METILIFGAFGGVARGLVGYSKYFFSYKSVKFDWKYFLGMVGISALMGFVVVWALEESGITFADGVAINPAIALIIGYAGGDAIENLYKIILKKPMLGPLKDILPK